MSPIGDSRCSVTDTPTTLSVTATTVVMNTWGTGDAVFISCDPNITSAAALLQAGQILLAGDSSRLAAGTYSVVCSEGCTAALVIIR